MDYEKILIRDQIVLAIENAPLSIKGKIRILQELDQRYRDEFGPFCFTDTELKERDILYRKIYIE